MTKRKLKFESYEWLLHTQDIERHQAATDHQRADELADLINVAIEYIESLGYDPVEIYSKRADEKAPEFAAIKAKYDLKFKEMKEETS